MCFEFCTGLSEPATSAGPVAVGAPDIVERAWGSLLSEVGVEDRLGTLRGPGKKLVSNTKSLAKANRKKRAEQTKTHLTCHRYFPNAFLHNYGLQATGVDTSLGPTQFSQACKHVVFVPYRCHGMLNISSLKRGPHFLR
jgi:hypothetical protein